MKKSILRFKNKKGFTLMEVVIALAVVGLICALVLPLTASAMSSFNAAQEMRSIATNATSKMSTVKYGADGKSKKTMYVTVKFESLGIKTENKMKFSQTDASDSKYGSKVTYYDLEQVNVKGLGETN